MKRTLSFLILLLSVGPFAPPAGAGAAGKGAPVLEKTHTAVLITDPQNEFLREDGKLYKLLADNLKELGTIDNIEKLMDAANKTGVTLVVDPLVYTAIDGD
jgi:isochorismate hydrolase